MNEALDGKPESIQDYRVPTSRLEQCQGDSITPDIYFVKDALLNRKPMQYVMLITRDRGVFMGTPDEAASLK